MMGMIRSLIRRTIALLASAAVVVYSTLCFSVSAEKEAGYWKYVKYWTEEDLLEDPIYDGRTAEGDAASGFHVHNQLIEHNRRGPYGDSPGQKGHQDCYGEYGDMIVTFSPLPNSKERYEVGELLSINVNLEADTSAHRLNPGGYVNIYLTWDPRSNPFSTFKEAGNGNDRIQPALDQSDGYTSLTKDFSGVFTQDIPAGNTGSYSHLYFCFHLVVQNGFINSFYEYEWVDTSETEPAAAVTEETTTESTEWIEQTVNKDAEATAGTDSGAVIDPDIVTGKNNTAKKAAAGAVGAAIVGGAVGSAVSSKKKKNPVIYKMVIGKEFGDTLYPGEHYTVYARIVQVHTGTGQTRNADEFSRKIEAFSEQFPVKAYYNSALNMMTAEFDVNEDNSNTAVLSFRLKGKGGVFTENVKFKVENLEKRIEVMYINSDGSIGEILDRHSEPIAHGLFLGENLCSTVYLAVFGYHNPPDVTAVCETTDLKPTVTYLERFEYSRLIQTFARKYDRYGYLLYCKFYKVDLGNRTAKPTSMFGQYPKHTKVQFTASSKRGATAGYSFPVALIPRGFFVDLSRADKSQKSDSYIELYTNELVNQNRSELKATPLPVYYGFMFEGEYRQFSGYNPHNRKIKVERIIFDNAEVNGNFTAKNPASEKIKMQKILDFKTLEVVSSQTGIAETGYAGWSYGWNRDSRLYQDRIPVFCPKMPVLQYQDSDEYLFDLEIRYETKNTDADSRLFAYAVQDTGTVPVRVYGEPAESPLHERHKELAKLDKIIHILDLEKTNPVRFLVERSDAIPTTDIHRFRRWLFDLGVQHQELIFKENMTEAAKFDRYIIYATSVKWICDTAFGVLLKIVSNDNAVIENAVLILKSVIEEVCVESYSKNKYFWEVMGDMLDWQHAANLSDKAISAALMDGAENLDWQKLCRVLVLLALCSTIKTIITETEKEKEMLAKGQTPEVSLWWRLISGTVNDMTKKTLSIGISKYLLKPGPALKDLITRSYNGVMSGLPDTVSIIPEVLELARDKNIINGDEPWDQALERKLAEKTGTVDLILSDGKQITVSKIQAAVMYTDKYLERWDISRLETLFNWELAAKQPYIGWRDTEETLSQHGIDTSDIHWS